MRFFVILSLSVLLPLMAQKPADEAAVRDVVKRYVDAREQRDPKAVEALFTSDSDQLVSSGEWRKGRPEVVKGTMASSQATGGKRTITVEAGRVFLPGVAIADGGFENNGTAGGGKTQKWGAVHSGRESAGGGKFPGP